MATKKPPSVYSAADAARAISRRLRKAGFLMADTSDRFKWTEGFHVHRIGCSRTVSVDYHMTAHVGSYGYTDETRKRYRDGDRSRPQGVGRLGLLGAGRRADAH